MKKDISSSKEKVFEIKCLKQAFNGNGIIKYIDKEYEVPNILKGEVGLFKVVKADKNKINLTLLEIVKKSDDRITSKCPYFNECGGCQYQHMSYESELQLKNEYLKELFKNFTNIDLKPVTGLMSPYNYRNKCQMTYKMSKGKNVVCGFYEEGSHKLVPVSDCKIQIEKATNIINQFNKVLTKNKIEPYDEKTRRGVIRHVLVRYGYNSKEILLVVVTNGEFFPGRKNVVNDLVKLNLGITTIVQNYNSRDTSIVLGDKERVLYGPGFIYDYINDKKFKISSRSFYQVNPVGMSILYNKAIEKANISKNDIVLDTYCGVGTIGILASDKAKKVYGVELNKDAYHDAIINAKLNGIKNIEFFNDDSTKFMNRIALNKEKVDILIMDPPRDGSTLQFIDAVGEIKPKKIVYVSCEPKTLVRDLYSITKKGYKLETVEAVDMFPRTYNLECLVLLNRRVSKDSRE